MLLHQMNGKAADLFLEIYRDLIACGIVLVIVLVQRMADGAEIGHGPAQVVDLDCDVAVFAEARRTHDLDHIARKDRAAAGLDIYRQYDAEQWPESEVTQDMIDNELK